MDALLPIIDDFMKRYNLGFASYTSSYWLEGIVCFKTNLKDLMDAYYMEKQRIEYYTSGDYCLQENEITSKKIN